MGGWGFVLIIISVATPAEINALNFRGAIPIPDELRRMELNAVPHLLYSITK